MDANILALANTIYGEGASSDYDTKVMIGSSMINRYKSGRTKEFGATLPQIAQKGYYAVSNPNVPYKQALSGKFPDDASANAYKQSMAIASGLIKGTIKPVEGQFYFTDKEKPKMNWKLLKEVGRTGKYKVWSYK
jgi:hypothetical protein